MLNTLIPPSHTNLFEEELRENLLLYTSSSPVSGKDLFQCHREIAIARYALSKQAETYATAVTILTQLLERKLPHLNLEDPNSANLLSAVMRAISDIEEKSQRLILSVQQVTQIVGKIVDIDVDKAALRGMLVQLPVLVKESINQLSNDPNLADSISSSLSEKITDFFSSIRFDTVSLDHNSQSTDTILDQVDQMINSVPAVSFTNSDQRAEERS